MPKSSTSPRPTPTILTGGLFSPFAEATLDATPSMVYEALLDTSIWSQWNNFVPSVTITKQPISSSDSADSDSSSRLTQHANMTFKVNMTSSVSTVSKEIVSVIDDAPHGIQSGRITRVCWIMDNKAMMTPKFLLHAERVNEIEDLGNGKCVYRTWETFGGPLARIVKWKYEQTLQDRFEDWVKGLQRYVEAKAQEAWKRERENAIELPA